MQKALLQRFKDTFTEIPKWAWQFKPPVPLVGHNYKPGKGLLIYASAENLAWLSKTTAPERFRTEDAWNRYRVVYEQDGRDSDDFFPDVGIQPVTDGGLFAAGLFVAEKVGLQKRARPRSFLETIAVSNWCKFSIEPASQDYVADVKKLTASLPFVVGELALLQPAVVIIPKTVWRHPILRAGMRGAAPRTQFLPVPQFNSTVVNTHLGKYDRAGRRLQKLSAETLLARWMENLRRINKNSAWRFIAMLDESTTSH
ncbi:MAG: hypothetical protein ACXABY_07510 [Candidatus Thorarchaeota archaeon]|jgi:hypothetical protein